MSRNIPRHLRQKQRPTELRRVISHEISITVLRTGAFLIWCSCLIGIGVIAINLVQKSPSGLGQWIWQPISLAAACIAGFVLGWRLWALRHWAAIVTLVVAWAFSLGEPWRPAHYAGGIIDVTAAIGASLAISALVAVPLTVAWVKDRSQLKSGF